MQSTFFIEVKTNEPNHLEYCRSKITQELGKTSLSSSALSRKARELSRYGYCTIKRQAS